MPGMDVHLYWNVMVAKFPAITDSLRQNFDMVTTVSTICEVAFSLATDQHKPNNTIISTSHNIQHQLSVIGPIKEEIKISFNYIQKTMLNVEEENLSIGSKRKMPPKQIARGKKGRYTLVSHILQSAHNLPRDQLHTKNKIKKNRKRATQIVDLHISASAEIESNAMKGRSICGGEELKFDTNRLIGARKSNSSTLKDIVIDPAIQRAKNMKVTELRNILVVAYPHKKKDTEDEEDHWPFRST